MSEQAAVADPSPKIDTFSDDERRDLAAYFNSRPLSRVWVRSEDDGISLSGFLGNTSAALEDVQLRLDGEVLPEARVWTWQGLDDPANDPDPKQFRVLRWWPRMSGYSFLFRAPFSSLEQRDAHESLRFEITGRDGAPIGSFTQAFHLPMADLHNHLGAPRPPAHLIHRVMGIDVVAEWILTGETNYQVFDEALRDTLGLSLASVGPVLEWGSGCGRLSRHLIAHGLPMTGIDIDEEAVAWCNANLVAAASAEARFLQCGLYPPTPLTTGGFKLAIGISVITHLDEEAGNQWLAELARLLQPGGILMLTTHGFDTFSVMTDPQVYRAICEHGFYSARSPHFDSLLGKEQDYYRQTWHTEEYIRDNWSRWFSLVKLFPGGHFGFQDLVILRRNEVIS